MWGVDISQDMVDLAKQQGPANIKYMVADCCQPLDLGMQFDVISCAFLLQHSKSEEMLEGFLTNIYNNLKPGGRAFGMNGGIGLDIIGKNVDKDNLKSMVLNVGAEFLTDLN